MTAPELPEAVVDSRLDELLRDAAAPPAWSTTPARGITRDELVEAIRRLDHAVYEPHVPVHHPRCAAVLPPYDPADCGGCGCG